MPERKWWARFISPEPSTFTAPPPLAISNVDRLAPPHVCPSGFGDRSHEEVQAAIDFADAEIEYLDASRADYGRRVRPECAVDGAEFERLREQDRLVRARNMAAFGASEARREAYRAIRDKRSRP